MRVVTNEAQIKRYRTISQILFFISLGGMGVGFFYSWTNPQSSSQISCLILPVLFIMTLASVRLANTWIREPRPVDVLSDALKGMGQKYTLFHYLLPAPHVLIGPEGVYALHTIWQDREYRVEGNKWHGDQGLARKLNGYLRQDLIGNPFISAQMEAKQVEKLLNKLVPEQDIDVKPLVVVIHPDARVEIDDPQLPVLFADPKKSPSLRDFLRNQRDGDESTVNEHLLDAIDRTYKLFTREEIEAIEAGELIYDPDKESYFAASDLQAAAIEAGEDELTVDAESEADVDASDGTNESGLVYVIQGGQLFAIGATTGEIESEMNRLKDESKYELEIVHTFETANADRVASRIQKKFARKEQKPNWFGLSKKDIKWIRSRKGN